MPATESPYNATLVSRQDLTPQLTVFRVKPDVTPYPFKPGQFAVLGLQRNAERIPEAAAEEPLDPAKADRLIRRAYSISSASQEDGFLEFYLSLVTSGQLTPRLFNLKEQDRLFLGKGAAGHFTLDLVPGDKDILMVATGTGLAPYISMLRTISLGEGCPVRKITVLHGAAYSWDLGYRRELEALTRSCPSLQYLPVISRPEEDKSWNGLTGRLTAWISNPQLESLSGFSLTPEQTHVFLCGNPGMIEDSETLLTGRGYTVGTRKEPGSLHREKYW
ncbi:MAG: ferredoxin--NADP reductase [Magnetococcales bacterium]|nr:ferredoxin--NADP reductase [Magnetococcales bacterium]